VTTNCKGELRFTSTIARRLDSLGALTRGQRQTGGQNLFDPADNLESEYAKAALSTWFALLADGKLKSATLIDFQRRSGLKIVSDDGILEEDLPPIQRWLNRILALPIGMQNAIFEEFLGLVEARVSAAREAGSLDVGVETLRVEQAEVVEDKFAPEVRERAVRMVDDQRDAYGVEPICRVLPIAHPPTTSGSRSDRIRHASRRGHGRMWRSSWRSPAC
jgi:hypothetical protein